MLNVVVACMSWGKTPGKQSMNRHCDARNRVCWIETFLMKEKLFGVLRLKRNTPRKFVLINKAKSVFFLILFLVLLINPIIHVWYIYLHLVDFHGKFRQIHHAWILWAIWVVGFFGGALICVPIAAILMKHKCIWRHGVLYDKPGTQMTLVLIWKRFVLRGWPSNIEVIWVLDSRYNIQLLINVSSTCMQV